jgi:hypothetical protein
MVLATTAILAVAVFSGVPRIIGALGGASTHQPEEMATSMSAGARRLVDEALRDVHSPRLLDYHTHIVGTGAWVNPAMRSWLSPLRHLRFLIYADAAGIDDLEQADSEYVHRLLRLIRSRPGSGRYQIIAFDHHYHTDGERSLESSEFYVPNDYVFALAAQHLDVFVPTMSINPYRSDAVADLERQVDQDGHILKWLPNAMGIDPADPGLDAFYDRMRELDVVLLTHAGMEQAVEVEAHQHFGNPLRLRRPLDRGVPVIVAHCGSLGQGEDLDHPGADPVSNFRLFLRLMDEPRYEGLMFG